MLRNAFEFLDLGVEHFDYHETSNTIKRRFKRLADPALHSIRPFIRRRAS